MHEVAVGPVHAGIIEPGHFRFQCAGEEVLHLEIALGYQHRGIEEALVGGPHRATLAQMETIAGDTTIAHATAYATVLEALAGTEAPLRAQWLRAVALELERLANHTGDLGALASDVAFLPTSAACGKLRGDFLNLTAMLCGNRFGRGLVRPGGCRGDLEPERARGAAASASTRRPRRRRAGDRLVLGRGLGARAIRERRRRSRRRRPRRSASSARRPAPAASCATCATTIPPAGTGSPRRRWPSGRAATSSPAPACARSRSSARATSCASSSRSGPEGELQGDLPAPAPDTLAVALVEGWRGEVCHVALTDEAGRFRRYKIVDPSFHNWTGLALAMRGQADLGLPDLQQELQPVVLRLRPLARSPPCSSSTPSSIACKRGCETMAYPEGPAPALPDRHGGALRVDAAKCAEGCTACVPVCPTQAITRPPGGAGRPRPGPLHRSARRASRPARRAPSRRPATTAWPCGRREDLVLGAPARRKCASRPALDEKLRRLFGRSLRLRQVSAGGCNACEADTNVLGTIVWDLGRFGIQFVASPRHADGLLITGPVTKSMELALKKTWDAVPAPKIVIAVGACAIAGGPFVGHAAGAQRRGLRRAGGPLHPRLPAPPADDPRRPAAPARPARPRARGGVSSVTPRLTHPSRTPSGRATGLPAGGPHRSGTQSARATDVLPRLDGALPGAGRHEPWSRRTSAGRTVETHGARSTPAGRAPLGGRRSAQRRSSRRSPGPVSRSGRPSPAAPAPTRPASSSAGASSSTPRSAARARTRARRATIRRSRSPRASGSTSTTSRRRAATARRSSTPPTATRSTGTASSTRSRSSSPRDWARPRGSIRSGYGQPPVSEQPQREVTLIDAQGEAHLVDLTRIRPVADRVESDGRYARAVPRRVRLAAP